MLSLAHIHSRNAMIRMVSWQIDLGSCKQSSHMNYRRSILGRIEMVRCVFSQCIEKTVAIVEKREIVCFLSLIDDCPTQIPTQLYI